MPDNFINLHSHSMGSLLDGFPRPEEIVDRAKELGHSAVAITDHGTMSTSLQFDQYAQEQGIKPIIGVEAYLAEDMTARNKEDHIYHIILLAKNAVGLKNLFQLSNAAWNEGFYKKPRIDGPALEKFSEGIIVLSGCMNGIISKALLDKEYGKAQIWTEKLSEIFRDDFYIEVQPWNPPELNKRLERVADDHRLPMVVTTDSHYCSQKEKAIEEIALVMAQTQSLTKKQKDLMETKFDESRKISDTIERINYLWPNRTLRYDEIDVYMMSREHLESRMGEFRSSIYDNTLEIAEKCDVHIPVNQDYFPKFYKRLDSDEYLRDLAFDKMAEKGIDSEEYTERLEEELSVISQLKFSDYMLVIWDMVNYAHSNGIRTGPGRGSVGGSLLAFVLGITRVDPIKHGLLFWRFLNVEFDYDPKFRELEIVERV